MDNKIRVTASQLESLNKAVSLLKERYSVEKVICFGLLASTKHNKSCFADALASNHDHYFLLVITKSLKRVEARIQNLLNQKLSSATATVVVIPKDEFDKTNLNRNRFFKPVFEHGLVLYDADPHAQTSFPEMEDGEKYVYTSVRFENRWENALGFRESTHKCMEEDRWHNAIFLLHQAVEQTCIAFIKVHLDHSAISHNLNYLLNLCLCIEPEISIFFPQNTNEEIRLFNVLNKAYYGGRYQESFEVNDKDLETLMEIIDEFMEFALNSCTSKIEAFQKEAKQVKGSTPSAE